MIDFDMWLKPRSHYSLENWTEHIKSLCERENGTCSSGYLSTSLRSLGYTRIYDVSALPDTAAISKRGFSPSHVSVIEGNPGVFMNQARWVADMLWKRRGRAKFIVGYRSPSALVISYYLFAGKSVARMDNAMKAGIDNMNACLISKNPHQLLVGDESLRSPFLE